MRSGIIFIMNRLKTKHRTQILRMLVEGYSLRGVARMAGISRNTVDKLLHDAGAVCFTYQNCTLRNLTCKRIQCNVIWSFMGMKLNNVSESLRGTYGNGDIYTWTAIDVDTKLIPYWHISSRNAESASEFINELADRLANRMRLTIDAHKTYLEAAERASTPDMDYATLIKLYGKPVRKDVERRYNLEQCTWTDKRIVPMELHSMNFVEQQNLSMRTKIKPFTHQNKSLSRKVESHMHAISLHFMYYNFCRIDKHLRVTPAMEAGISDHAWSLEEVVGLTVNEAPKKRGPYNKDLN